MKKQFFALVLVCFYIFPTSANAARSITITSDKTSLIGEEEMIVSASISGFTENETIYLKSAFFYPESTNYFGYIKKDEAWVKNSVTATEQKKIVIGSWDGQAQIKSDFSDTGFQSDGDYNFKLGFYYITSGGNLSSVNWSSILPIRLEKGVTVEPTTTQISSSTITKAPTVSKVTPKPTTSIAKVTQKVTEMIRSNNSAKITENLKSASQFAKLNINLPKEKPSPELRVLGTKEDSSPNLGLIGGTLFLTLAILVLGRNELKKRNIL